MKCKSKSYYLFVLFLVSFLFLSPICSITSRAEEIEDNTSQETVESFLQRTNFYGILADVCKNTVVFPDWTGSNNNLKQLYIDWLEQKALDSYLDAYVTVTQDSGTPGSRGYDIPQEVRQSMVDFVMEEYVDNNNLSYSYQTIYSYTLVSSQLFNTQVQMQAFKNEISKLENVPYVFIPNYLATSNQSNGQIMYYDEATSQEKTVYIGNTEQGVRAFFYYAPTNGVRNIEFYNSSGHVANYQDLATLIPTANWQSIASWNSASNKVLPTGWHGVIVWPNGQVKAATGLFRPSINTYRNSHLLLNAQNASGFSVFSTKSYNENVFVFDSLQAIKMYVSNEPQSYYFPTDSTTNVPSYQPLTDSSIQGASSYYNNVVNNTTNGMTGEQVIKLVDLIINGNGSSGSGGSGSDTENDGWLDLGIFGDIGKAIAKVIGAIITAIASIFEEIIGIVTQVSDTLLQGVIFEFLSAFIGWLPDEIIALLTALFSVAVLFALVKLIREAF